MSKSSGSCKTLLIIGASSGIGLATLSEALRRGFRVRGFARSAQRIAITDPRLEKVAGDATNAADVRAALIGADAVVLALGIAAGPQMVLGPVTLFSQATRVVVDAMQIAGTRRLVCVTGYGAGDSRSSIGCLQRIAFEAALGRAYADKDVQEQIIKASSLDWVIARPGILTNGDRTARFKVLRDAGSWRNGFVSRADVADFLLDQLESDTYLRTAPVIVG